MIGLPPPLWILRIVLPAYSLLLGALARLPGGSYFRFLILPDWCKRAVDRGDYGQATALAQELLALAAKYPTDWNFGNAVHHGHLVLGRAALAVNDLPTARAELLAAGHTPGSPQLNSFGPNMSLAQELLHVGEREVVLAYLDLCRSFWTMGADQVTQWSSAISSNSTPDFGPNLVY
jgi:hypothetical protein